MLAAVRSESDRKCAVKELWTRSCTNISHQGVLGHSPPVPHKTVQRITPRGTPTSIPGQLPLLHRGSRKHGLDPADMKNYRPISNLSFMSKIVERVVVRQLSEYPYCEWITSYAAIWIPKASFHRVGSTSGVVRHSLLSGQGTYLVAGVARCECRFRHGSITPSCSTGCPSRSGTAFDWMRSFIVGRTQTVHYCGSVSRCAVVRSGVAQGSVLGPLIYVLYTADIQRLVVSLGFGVHLYADDTQFHGSCKPADAADLAVISSVKTWMSSNRLRLNADKTQFIWLGTQPLPWKTRHAGRQLHPAVKRRRQQSWSLPGLGARHGSSGEQTMSSLLLSPATVANGASIAHQGNRYSH